MNPWLLPWWEMFKGPLSGNVTQDISPITSWLSPQLEFNFAGDHLVEKKVVEDVASYGKQLGILSEALLEIADSKNGAAVDKLKKLIDQIDEVKNQHAESLEYKIKADLNRLKEKDPVKLKRLIDEYR